jgi:branched-subunit amino acid transport protein
MMVWVIMGMFVVTFGVRFVLYARAEKVTLPLWVEKALRFVPVSVLSALIMPMIFMPNKQWDISLANPWLVGSVVAFILGLVRQQPLLTIVGGVVAFFLTQWLTGGML